MDKQEKENADRVNLHADAGIERPCAERLRRLAGEHSDLHCGGIDDGELLPASLRRERFVDMTAGIVA